MLWETPLRGLQARARHASGAELIKSRRRGGVMGNNKERVDRTAKKKTAHNGGSGGGVGAFSSKL